MKILFLTDGVHPFLLGGMQKHSLILAGLLAEREVQLTLYHPGGKGYSSEAFYENFGAERKFIEECMIPWPKKGKLPGHYLRENKQYSKAIYESVRDKLDTFDLVYAQGFTAWQFIKAKNKGEITIPILVNFHGFEMFQTPANRKAALEQKLLTKAVKTIILSADGVYSFGGHIDKAIRDVGVRQDKILLHSNGITENWLTSKSANEIRNQKRTLTFVGRNERRKGIEELNAALREILKREEHSFIFNFIGPIPTEVQIKDDRLIYHGEIRDAAKIQEILQQSDCLVCPSHSEGMPTVILEGMASGLAVIATDVGAVSRQIKENGYLLPNPDPEGLSKAILDIVTMTPEELNTLKNNSLEHVRKHFLWDVIADKKLAQFKNILDTTR